MALSGHPEAQKTWPRKNRSTFGSLGIASDLTCGAPFPGLGVAPVSGFQEPAKDGAATHSDSLPTADTQTHQCDIQAPGSMEMRARRSQDQEP